MSLTCFSRGEPLETVWTGMFITYPSLVPVMDKKARILRAFLLKEGTLVVISLLFFLYLLSFQDSLGKIKAEDNTHNCYS